MIRKVKIKEIGDYSVILQYTSASKGGNISSYITITEINKKLFIAKEYIENDRCLLLYFDKSVKGAFSEGEDCLLGLWGYAYALAKL